jgi:hypothetical protein
LTTWVSLEIKSFWHLKRAVSSLGYIWRSRQDCPATFSFSPGGAIFTLIVASWTDYLSIYQEPKEDLFKVPLCGPYSQMTGFHSVYCQHVV